MNRGDNMFDFDVREVGKTFKTGKLNGWDCVIMDKIDREIKVKEIITELKQKIDQSGITKGSINISFDDDGLTKDDVNYIINEIKKYCSR